MDNEYLMPSTSKYVLETTKSRFLVRVKPGGACKLYIPLEMFGKSVVVCWTRDHTTTFGRIRSVLYTGTKPREEGTSPSVNYSLRSLINTNSVDFEVLDFTTGETEKLSAVSLRGMQPAFIAYTIPNLKPFLTYQQCTGYAPLLILAKRAGEHARRAYVAIQSTGRVLHRHNIRISRGSENVWIIIIAEYELKPV